MNKKYVVLSSHELHENGEFPNFERTKDGQLMYLGGQVRMDAASVLFEQDSDAEFIMLAGLEIKDKKTVWGKAKQMEGYLLKKHPDMKISCVDSLPCTRHNLVALANKWKDEDLSQSEVSIVSNAYHEPRVMAWVESLKKEGLTLPEFKYISPTSLGMKEAVHETEESYSRRVESEAAGVKRITSGEYSDHCTREFISELQRLKLIDSGELNKMLTSSEKENFFREDSEGKRL